MGRPLSLPSSKLAGPLPPRGVGRLDSPLDSDLLAPITPSFSSHTPQHAQLPLALATVRHRTSVAKAEVLSQATYQQWHP